MTSKNAGGKNERCVEGRECFAKKVAYHLGIKKFTGYPLVVKRNRPARAGLKKQESDYIFIAVFNRMIRTSKS